MRSGLSAPLEVRGQRPSVKAADSIMQEALAEFLSKQAQSEGSNSEPPAAVAEDAIGARVAREVQPRTAVA